MSFTEMHHWVHFGSKVYNNVVVARHTVSYSHHFCLDRGLPRRQHWRNNSLDSCSVKGKTHSSQMLNQRVDTTRSSVNNFAQIKLLVPRRVRHHAVGHRLWTSLRCIDNQMYQQCVVECEIFIHGNLLRRHSRYMRLYAFQHDFQQHHASITPKKQLRKPWRHN